MLKAPMRPMMKGTMACRSLTLSSRTRAWRCTRRAPITAATLRTAARRTQPPTCWMSFRCFSMAGAAVVAGQAQGEGPDEHGHEVDDGEHRRPHAQRAAGRGDDDAQAERPAAGQQQPDAAARGQVAIHFAYFARAPLRRSSQARPRERAAR